MKNFILTFTILILSFNIVLSQTGWDIFDTGNSNYIWSLSFPNQYTGWIVGNGGMVRKTIDGGMNWITQSSNTTSILAYVQFINTSTGYIIGHNGTIRKTTDGGNSWISQSAGTFSNFFQCSFINSETGWISGDAGIYKTTNGGQTWTVYFNPGGNFYSVFFLDQNYGWTQMISGMIYLTTNGGASWLQTESTQGFPIVSFHFVNQQMGWAVGYGGKIYKTTNGGHNWSQQVNPVPNNQLMSVWFTDNSGQKGWIAGYSWTLLKTTNSGVNWIQISIPNYTDYTCVRFSGSQYGWISCGNGTILRTTTGGEIIPGAPALSSPPNNSTEVSQTPVLDWFDTYSALNYKTEISTIPNFTVISDSATVTNSEYTFNYGKLTGGITYFWRVRASNLNGTGPWSQVWNFATAQGPHPPVLISPPNGSQNIPLIATLIWNTSAGASNYRYRISDNPAFSTITDSGTTSSTQTTISGKLSSGILYYWQVRAYNSSGQSGGWCPTWKFRTISPPSAPVLISPPNGIIGVTYTPTLVWSKPVNAVNYKVQISTVWNFSIITDSATTSDTLYTVPFGKLSNYITYFWRVNAFNQMGSSPWSSTFSLTVLVTDIRKSGREIPSVYNLYENYPNPFNPVTTIRFDLPKKSFVYLTVYDLLGREIVKLVQKELEAGIFNVTFNAGNLPGGVYFYKIEASNFSAVRKMIIVK